MDAARIRLASPNGAGLRPITLAEGPIEVVDHLAVRTAGGCPYGLGTSCPLMEIAKGSVKLSSFASHAIAIAAGLGISIISVWVVHFS